MPSPDPVDHPGDRGHRPGRDSHPVRRLPARPAVAPPQGVLLVLSAGATLMVLGWFLELLELDRRRTAAAARRDDGRAPSSPPHGRRRAATAAPAAVAPIGRRPSRDTEAPPLAPTCTRLTDDASGRSGAASRDPRHGSRALTTREADPAPRRPSWRWRRWRAAGVDRSGAHDARPLHRQATSTGSFAAPTPSPRRPGWPRPAAAPSTLTWTPSVDTYATGYSVWRGSATSGAVHAVGTVTPGIRHDDDGRPGRRHLVLRPALHLSLAGRASHSNQASATVGGDPRPPTIQACVRHPRPRTRSAPATTTATRRRRPGPARTTVVAADDPTAGTAGPRPAGPARRRASTRTATGSGATAFGLPGSVPSITGIPCAPTWRTNNNGGTTNLCAQLSWDGGTTWTTIKASSVERHDDLHVRFGRSDTWGRTWTLAELGPAQLPRPHHRRLVAGQQGVPARLRRGERHLRALIDGGSRGRQGPDGKPGEHDEPK